MSQQSMPAALVHHTFERLRRRQERMPPFIPSSVIDTAEERAEGDRWARGHGFAGVVWMD